MYFLPFNKLALLAPFVGRPARAKCRKKGWFRARHPQKSVGRARVAKTCASRRLNLPGWPLAVRTPHLVAEKQSSAMRAGQAEKPCLRYPGRRFLRCGRGAARALAAAIAVSSLITLPETCFASAGVSGLVARLIQS